MSNFKNYHINSNIIGHKWNYALLHILFYFMFFGFISLIIIDAFILLKIVIGKFHYDQKQPVWILFLSTFLLAIVLIAIRWLIAFSKRRIAYWEKKGNERDLAKREEEDSR